jgi:hypothetical protein
MPSKRILVAIHPRDLHTVNVALGAEFPVTVCHTLKDAEAELGPEIGLVACGVHFDEGTMFELLKAVKANAQMQDVPFYLLVGDQSNLTDSMLSGIRSAAKLLGSAGFIELSKLKQEVGEVDAYERLRSAVKEALGRSVIPPADKG